MSKVAPVAEHRDEAYKALVNRMTNKERVSSASQVITRLSSEILEEAELSDHRAISLAVRLSVFRIGEWSLKYFEDPISGSTLLGSLVKLLFVVSQFKLHDRIRFNDGFDAFNLLESSHVGAYLALVALGQNREATCVRRHLKRMLEKGAFNSLRFEQNDYCEFIRLVVAIDESSNWPTTSEIQRLQLGEFGRLFVNIGDANGWSNELDKYADFRVARALEYPSQFAKKKNPPGYSDELCMCCTELVPIELFALRALYGRVSGREYPLASKHPLLAKELVGKFPLHGPLQSDATTTHLESLGKITFGTNWDLYRTIIEEAAR